MKILFACLLTLAYWLLTSYQDIIYFDISFIQAVSLDYEQANPFIKIAAAGIIFILALIIGRNKSNTNDTVIKEESFSQDMLNTIFKTSDIVLSSLKLDKQLDSIASALESYMDFKCSMISNFEDDTICVLNSNESLKELNIKGKYFPKQINIASHALDKLISTVYMEKREFLEDTMSINEKNYRVIAHLYKDKKNEPLGIFCVFLDPNDEHDYNQFISKICNQIVFTIKFIEKKESTFRAQNIFTEKFALVDRNLNVATNAKLQQLLVREMSRAERYHSNLSLIIIEIDYLNNVENMLSKDELAKVKKEIIDLFKKGVRDTDLFGKWNETQFAIVATDVDFNAAKSFVNKLNRNLTVHRFYKIGKVTCSYGITSYYKKDSLGALIQRAESALKVAVQNGGNSIETNVIV